MIVITAVEFRAYFDRGQFPYGSAAPSIRDKDIDAAIAEAEAVFNHDLYPLVATERLALLYLSAHFLQNDIEAADSEGQAKFNQTSRSADGVSESLQIPTWMTEGIFAQYATTYYGQKWIAISAPLTFGMVFSVSGGTQF